MLSLLPLHLPTTMTVLHFPPQTFYSFPCFPDQQPPCNHGHQSGSSTNRPSPAAGQPGSRIPTSTQARDSGAAGSAGKKKSERRGTEMREKSVQRIQVDEEAIGKRWADIKEQERAKLKAAGEARHPDVVLLYEVSRRRKSDSLIPVIVVASSASPASSLTRSKSDGAVRTQRTS